MRRRQVLAALATGVAGALAGCSDTRARLSLEPVDDRELAERYARTERQLPEAHRGVVADAVAGENATAEGVEPPLQPERPVRHDGAYYRLSWTAVDERTDTRYEVEVDYGPGDATPAAGEVALSELPGVDRRALEGLVPTDRDDPDLRDGFDAGTSVVYADAEAEQSVLVPDQQYDVVTHEGERYLVSVGEREPVTVHVYRYTAEQVAADDAGMADRVRERYLFELSGLSDAQRRILDAAEAGGYAEDEPTEAFRGLADELRAHDAVEPDEYGAGGEWLVRHDGTDYWVRLSVPETYREATVARATPSEY